MTRAQISLTIMIIPALGRQATVQEFADPGLDSWFVENRIAIPFCPPDVVLCQEWRRSRHARS